MLSPITPGSLTAAETVVAAIRAMHAAAIPRTRFLQTIGNSSSVKVGKKAGNAQGGRAASQYELPLG